MFSCTRATGREGDRTRNSSRARRCSSSASSPPRRSARPPPARRLPARRPLTRRSRQFDFDVRDTEGAGGRLPDPATWEKNPELLEYVEKIRDLWQEGDVDGPIGLYMSKNDASLADFVTELNSYKVRPPPPPAPPAQSHPPPPPPARHARGARSLHSSTRLRTLPTPSLRRIPNRAATTRPPRPLRAARHRRGGSARGQRRCPRRPPPRRSPVWPGRAQPRRPSRSSKRTTSDHPGDPGDVYHDTFDLAGNSRARPRLQAATTP